MMSSTLPAALCYSSHQISIAVEVKAVSCGVHSLAGSPWEPQFPTETVQAGGGVWQSYRMIALVRRIPGPVRWACAEARPGKPLSAAPSTDTHGLKMV